MLEGCVDQVSGKWIGGFFDRGSFTETLAGWAKTVICGRARLGGIPMGVIAVETRTVEQIKPADPAALESHEDVIPQAGQVWYPDSAYKTAQAIKDFNKGEELPLIIFANWRGFSGGLRDLFFEILKYGSYIVDNLREYRQPVFIYIPPFGELRGGAWVVLDPTINANMMEMYCASENARGGILEPNGTIEIKFKQPDVLKTMHRLDPKLRELDIQLKKLELELKSTNNNNNTNNNNGSNNNKVSSSSSSISSSIADGLTEVKEKLRSIRAAIAALESDLLPVYTRIATSFADLHDTCGRMQTKGVAGVVPWSEARRFFYWRLRRRLAEEALAKKFHSADPMLEIRGTIRNWAHEEWRQREGISNRTATTQQTISNGCHCDPMESLETTRIPWSWSFRPSEIQQELQRLFQAQSKQTASSRQSSLPIVADKVSDTGSSTVSNQGNPPVVGPSSEDELRAFVRFWNDDRAVLSWLTGLSPAYVAARVKAIRFHFIRTQICERFGLEDPSAVVAGVLGLWDNLDAEQRAVLAAAVAQLRANV